MPSPGRSTFLNLYLMVLPSHPNNLYLMYTPVQSFKEIFWSRNNFSSDLTGECHYSLGGEGALPGHKGPLSMGWRSHQRDHLTCSSVYWHLTSGRSAQLHSARATPPSSCKIWGNKVLSPKFNLHLALSLFGIIMALRYTVCGDMFW